MREVFKRKLYDRTSFVNYERCGEILNELDLTEVYKSGEHEIIELYPCTGVWGRAVCELTKPSRHVALEHIPAFHEYSKKLNSDLPTMLPIAVDPYKWSVYTSLIKYGGINPQKLPSDKINPSLLVIGNLTTSQSKQLLDQFLVTVMYRNWLQHYGCVRMLLWTTASVASKVTLTQGERHRGRLAALAGLFTDITPVATFYEHKDFAKAIKIKRAQAQKKLGRVGSDVREKTTEFAPVPYNKKTLDANPVQLTSADVLGRDELVLLDIKPKPIQAWEDQVSMPAVEYVFRNLFILSSVALSSAVSSLGPGAPEYLSQKLPAKMMAKHPIDLSNEEFIELLLAFENWPFKPEHYFDITADADDTLQAAPAELTSSVLQTE
ncbi:ribosomal RNA adenine methyltransferase KsgA/Erm [Myxozyma melibiosi]|uniref:rRNA adenine N(6)-methyltransferase n=1 Tax=Myxozyma melibiosi TaxID=54550 RepID=A0ABR1F887_9ASCO